MKVPKTTTKQAIKVITLPVKLLLVFISIEENSKLTSTTNQNKVTRKWILQSAGDRKEPWKRYLQISLRFFSGIIWNIKKTKLEPKKKKKKKHKYLPEIQTDEMRGICKQVLPWPRDNYTRTRASQVLLVELRWCRQWERLSSKTLAMMTTLYGWRNRSGPILRSTCRPFHFISSLVIGLQLWAE